MKYEFNQNDRKKRHRDLHSGGWKQSLAKAKYRCTFQYVFLTSATISIRFTNHEWAERRGAEARRNLLLRTLWGAKFHGGTCEKWFKKLLAHFWALFETRGAHVFVVFRPKGEKRNFFFIVVPFSAFLLRFRTFWRLTSAYIFYKLSMWKARECGGWPIIFAEKINRFILLFNENFSLLRDILLKGVG